MFGRNARGQAAAAVFHLEREFGLVLLQSNDSCFATRVPKCFVVASRLEGSRRGYDARAQNAASSNRVDVSRLFAVVRHEALYTVFGFDRNDSNSTAVIDVGTPPVLMFNRLCT